jgi:hypothetical protein
MMLRPTKVAAALLALTAMTLLMSTAKANVIVIIPDNKDATIFEDPANNSNGAGPEMYAGDNGAGSPRRALLEFNIAANVPKGATINSVQLTLVLAMVAGQGGGNEDMTPRDIALHTLLKDWGEGTTNGAGQGQMANPGDATWNQNFFNANPNVNRWTNKGGDFTAAASADTIVSQNVGAPYMWGSTPGMVTDVQNWLNAPGSNFGWILVGDEVGMRTFRAFYTRDQANPEFTPKLTVNYTAPVPEPSTLLPAGLGALVGAGCWWRRRRAAVA